MRLERASTRRKSKVENAARCHFPELLRARRKSRWRSLSCIATAAAERYRWTLSADAAKASSVLLAALFMYCICIKDKIVSAPQLSSVAKPKDEQRYHIIIVNKRILQRLHPHCSGRRQPAAAGDERKRYPRPPKDSISHCSLKIFVNAAFLFDVVLLLPSICIQPPLPFSL